MHSRLNIPAPAGIKAANDATEYIDYVIERRSLGVTRSASVEKLSRKVRSCSPSRPYRKPTQVGECKRTQARERNLSKELGTLAS
jgi:hypothetical protein